MVCPLGKISERAVGFPGNTLYAGPGMSSTRATNLKTCNPDPGNLGIFRTLKYSPEDTTIWRDFFSAHRDLLENHVHPAIGAGFQKLGISPGSIKDLTQLYSALYEACGWRLIEVDGLVPEPDHLLLLARRIFPCSPLLRPPAGFFPWPDLLHELYHLPLMLEPAFGGFLQELGMAAEMALAENRQDILNELSRIYWYLVEYGAMQVPGGLKLYGATISSYLREANFLLENSQLLRPVTNIDEIASTLLPWEADAAYSLDKFQGQYFLISSFVVLHREFLRWRHARFKK
jgi:phenylalanine-4-hydroxylase